MALTLPRIYQTVIFICGLSSLTCGTSSEKYKLPGPDCNRYGKGIKGADIDGKGLFSYTDECELQLTTGSKDKWMFRVFDMTLMSCLVSVKIYDRYDPTGRVPPLFHFRCASPDPGIVLLNTSYARVVLQHNNRTNYQFKIVFTARKPKDRCDGFVCRNQYCISRDLLCDRTDNCFDYSDESENTTAYCIYYDPFPGENFAVLLSVVGGSIVMGVIAFCCRMLRQRRQQHYLEEDMDDFQNGPYVKKYAYMYAVIKPQNRTRVKRHRSRSRMSHHVDISGDEPEF